MVDEPPVQDKVHIEVKSKRRGLPFRNKVIHTCSLPCLQVAAACCRN